MLAHGYIFFHLSALEAIFMKPFQPYLSQHKELKTHSLTLFLFASDWLLFLTNQSGLAFFLIDHFLNQSDALSSLI